MGGDQLFNLALFFGSLAVILVLESVRLIQLIDVRTAIRGENDR
jgi:hypothetical protein